MTIDQPTAAVLSPGMPRYPSTSSTLLLVLGILVHSGCGGATQAPPTEVDARPQQPTSVAAQQPPQRSQRPLRNNSSTQFPPQRKLSGQQPTGGPRSAQQPLETNPSEGTNLGEPSDEGEESDSALRRWRLPEVPQERLQLAGIRRFEGRHLELLTDVRREVLSDTRAEELTTIFDQAYPLWCEYLGLRRRPLDRGVWKLRAHLVDRAALFQSLGLWREELPDFRFGYAFPDAVWMYEQNVSDYYRRHLLLHEGVHALMYSRLGSCGPPWYMEGLAEWLATHRWQDGRLSLPVFPESSDNVPGLGRVEIVRETLRQGARLRLEDVLGLTRQAHLRLEPYGWCWALASLLDTHPRYRERFRAIPSYVADPAFATKFQEAFGPDWPLLRQEWQLFAHNLEYGYDIAATALPAAHQHRPVPESGSGVTISAQRGWQTTGLFLQGGKQYRVQATGRFQIAASPPTAQSPQGRPWMSEAGGISYRYYQGDPLGVLLAAIVPGELTQPGLSQPAFNQPAFSRRGATVPEWPLLNPIAVGRQATLRPKRDGVLYLKVNDSAGELQDNRGQLQVEVIPQGS